MESAFSAILDASDQWVRNLLAPLAFWILLSGLDDLIVDIACAVAWIKRRYFGGIGLERPSDRELRAVPQKRIAIFVPAWHEDAVIGPMVANNTSRMEYRNCEFFVGVYPNDAPTLAVVRALEHRYPNVHMAVCPHNGPTSKADCLNWVYRRMKEREQELGVRYDFMVTHDSEDLIHPMALHWINYYGDWFDMVQIPVLPLPTRLREMTHGIYCDEFAEYQMKDMPARHLLGGFIPSNGVGTGFSRWALEQLHQSGGGIFETVCLTEDYENGLRLHLLGCPQLFVSIQLERGDPMATREYFPMSFRAAVKQRTRWVTGIALQTWERHGWPGGWRQVYWLWRDRKGLIGNPVSLLTTLTFAYGLATAPLGWMLHRPWGLNAFVDYPFVLVLLGTNFFLQLLHASIRMGCVAHIYGWKFASAAPVRTLYGNLINCAATYGAVKRFLRYKILGEPLVWLKTDHSYPQLEAAAIESSAAPSVQAVRVLPAHILDRHGLIPYRIASGRLFLATIERPDQALEQALHQFTTLELSFELVTPENFRRLRAEMGL